MEKTRAFVQKAIKAMQNLGSCGNSMGTTQANLSWFLSPHPRLHSSVKQLSLLQPTVSQVVLSLKVDGRFGLSRRFCSR